MAGNYNAPLIFYKYVFRNNYESLSETVNIHFRRQFQLSVHTYTRTRTNEKGIFFLVKNTQSRRLPFGKHVYIWASKIMTQKIDRFC